MFVYINHSSSTFACFLLVAVVVVVIAAAAAAAAVLINLEITQHCREVVCIYVHLGGRGFTSDPGTCCISYFCGF